MTDKEIQRIYLTLTGQLIPGAEVPGVPDAFCEGSECDRLLDEIYEARNRVQERLGGEDDADLERILGGYEAMQEVLCLEMFRLGLRWATAAESL